MDSGSIGSLRTAGRRREIADDHPQRMLATDLVVTVGSDDQCPRRLDPPPDESKRVERRLVGPMQIIEEQDQVAVFRPEGGEQGAEERIPRCLFPHEARELVIEVVRDIDEWAEGTGCGQWIARSKERHGRRTESIPERPQEGRLAHPRLALDEDEPAASGCGLATQSLEGRQWRVTLEQAHGRS